MQDASEIAGKLTLNVWCPCINWQKSLEAYFEEIMKSTGAKTINKLNKDVPDRAYKLDPKLHLIGVKDTSVMLLIILPSCLFSWTHKQQRIQKCCDPVYCRRQGQARAAL